MTRASFTALGIALGLAAGIAIASHSWNETTEPVEPEKGKPWFITVDRVEYIKPEQTDPPEPEPIPDPCEGLSDFQCSYQAARPIR